MDTSGCFVSPPIGFVIRQDLGVALPEDLENDFQRAVRAMLLIGFEGIGCQLRRSGPASRPSPDLVRQQIERGRFAVAQA